jgi:Cu(I)/Ag(I) efflux system membrane fusion protein
MSNARSKLLSWLIFIIVVSVGVNVYLLASHGAKTNTASAGQEEELYVCPMHPQVRQDHPGDCPICGMKLVKQTVGTRSDVQTDSIAGTVNLSPSQEVLANVATELPQRMTFHGEKTIPGRILAKEDAVWGASARVMGRIERLYISTPGGAVVKNQPLYDFFSPDLASAQRELVIAKQASDPQTRDLLLAGARSKLASLGMESEQIADLEKTLDIKETLTFHAMNSGVLTEKMASEGQWVMPGMNLLNFTDLSEVWVEGILYEKDVPFARMGDNVKVVVPGQASPQAQAKISYIAPTVDMMTRTVAFRATLNNPSLVWKPEMYVQVLLSEAAPQEALSVPEDAVLSTGRSDRVWVKVGEGRYQMREVTVGQRQDGRVMILSGLNPDENVVVSGGYLIDSDAQVKMGGGHEGMKMDEGASPGKGSGSVAQPMDMSRPAQTMDNHDSMKGMNKAEPSAPSEMPGMNMESPPADTTRQQGKHSGHSMSQIQKADSLPHEIWVCPMPQDSFVSDKPGRCPKCGMALVKKEG